MTYEPELLSAQEGRSPRVTAWEERATVRWMDISGSLAALVLLAPVFLAVSVLILFEDGRPIFFRQKRVGRNGALFNVWKFRTMRRTKGGPSITIAGDRRITRLGVKLRKYKLDELPQFLCVLRGHMSLIGPRPEVPKYVEPSGDLWQEALKLRPGITNLAALAFRNEEDILAPIADADSYYRSTVLPAKLRLDLEYQRSRSLLRDFKLLWMTARYSFFPRGFDRDRIVRSFSA
jgi:lipopolysaccharide/colanic/teichoic acid biosynthesis glycosyltransferase